MLLSGFVFVAVGLFNTGLWIGEEAAFDAPGLVTSSELAREENKFCEVWSMRFD